MSNEFYCVSFESGTDFYFKNKDNAYTFLWQEYLNCYGNETDEQRKEAEEQLYDFAIIDGIGEIYVLGFED